MSEIGPPTNRTAYLLRSWLEGATWRFSLEEVGADKRYGFANVDELVSFLVARTEFTEQREKPGIDGGPLPVDLESTQETK